LAYRSQMQTALDSLDATDIRADWRATSRTLVQNNIAFMDACVENGAISLGDLQSFARKQAPLLKGNIAWAAETQVNHWMGVIAGWKEPLGSDWDKTGPGVPACSTIEASTARLGAPSTMLTTRCKS
jgi:hypothetical protein